jgi:cobalt-zinc-cadmium efflux system protein
MSDHDHDGHHHHRHDHAPMSFGQAFAIGIALNLAYVAAEALYTPFAN